MRQGFVHKSRTPRKASGSKGDLVRALPYEGREAGSARFGLAILVPERGAPRTPLAGFGQR